MGGKPKKNKGAKTQRGPSKLVDEAVELKASKKSIKMSAKDDNALKKSTSSKYEV